MPGVGSSKGVSKPQTTATDTGANTGGAVSDYKAFYTAIAKSPTLTTAWSKMLKAAGYYKGPITDKYNAKLQRALDNAEQDRLTIAAVRPLERDVFIQEQIGVNQSSGSGATRTVSYVSNPTEAKKLINDVIRATNHRDASAEEVNRLYKDLVKAQKSSPVVYGDTSQTGGLDAEQYLIDKVAQTDEARANKVMGFYNTFMNALGSK